MLSVEDEIQLFIAKRQTGNCIPAPPRYHSYYVDEEMVRSGSIIAPVAPSHERVNEIVSGVREEVERCERVESMGFVNVSQRRNARMASSEAISRSREVSIASPRRESMHKEFNVDGLERDMSQVSIRTTPRMQEPESTSHTLSNTNMHG